MPVRPQSILPLAIGGTFLILACSNLVRAETAIVKPPTRETPRRPEASVAVAPRWDLTAVRETDEEMRLVELANKERVHRGLRPLEIDPLLIEVARGHSAEMRDKAYFNHTSPTAGCATPMDRYLRAVPGHPKYACVGENLFWATVVDVNRGHEAFMQSPTHRENM